MVWNNSRCLQRSILGPLLFDIFLNYLFLYPEETFLSMLTITPCTQLAMQYKMLRKHLAIGNWFHENLMVLNEKKCHYMCFGIGSENDDFIFDGIKSQNSCEEKILYVTIDDELKFHPHIESMCKKAA